MDIRVLQYFLTVAKEESISKAAKVLHMTQPPLSRQLMELEQELGKQLLIRGHKNVTLTEDGLLLRNRAQELVDLMEKTRAELASSDDHVSGDIYIGSGETKAVSILAQTAKQLQERYPHIHYHLYSGDSERVLDCLDNGLIDFGLLIGDVNLGKYESVKLPISDHWGVLMRKDSPLSQYESVHIEDLNDQMLILSHQASTDKSFRAKLRLAKADQRLILTYDLIYNATLFVKQRFGYAIALDGLINTSGDSVLCFVPFSPPLKADIHLARKRNQVFSKASRLFLQELQNQLQ